MLPQTSSAGVGRFRPHRHAVAWLVGLLLCAAVPAAAQDYLAATPDADSADPYVVAKAAVLGNDPAQIFAFVRDEIRYESYRGSLRGARGTLWSAAGNALDKASLLIALLRAAGVPARYAEGTLSDDLAQQLVLSMFPTPARVLGCLGPGVEVADPANDPRLLAEAREHFWAQFDIGGGFWDADPTFAAAQPDQAFTAVQATFAEVPDELRHKVALRLRRELTLPGAGLLTGGAGSQDVATVLDESFPTVSLVGRSLSVGHFVNASVLGAVISLQTNTYSPYVLVNQRDGDVSDDTLIRGDDYQETLTNFPFGSELLTGVFLDVTTTTPTTGGGTDTDTVTKVLLDRIGLVGRSPGGVASIALPADDQPPLTDTDIVSLEVSTSDQPEDPLLAQSDVATQRSADLDVLRAANPNPDTAPAEVRQQIGRLARLLVLDNTSLVGGAFAFGSDSVRADFAGAALIRGYLDSPRIVAVSNRSDPGPPPERGRFSIDILRDRPRGEPYPFQASSAAKAFRLGQGLIDSIIEASVIEPDPASGLVGASSVAILTQALAQPGARLLTLAQKDVAQLELLPLSDEAKLRIAASLGAGDRVLVPSAPVNLNGADRIAWLEINPAGNAIAVSDDGEHSGTVERTGLTPFEKLYIQRLEQQLVLEEEENAAAAAANSARNPRTIVDAVCNAYTRVDDILEKNLFGPQIDGVGPANGWVLKAACRKDPPIGEVLFGSPEPSPDFATLGNGASGVAVDAVVDSFFTVPLGGAEAPTVFRVGFKNLTAATDTFKIQPSDIPAGFSVCQSVPGLTLAPGQNGEITVALIPDGSIPAPGTPAPFKVTATSMTNPAITATSNETFGVPEIHGVTLTGNPPALATTPGIPVSTTLTLRSVGNVAENVTFDVQLPSGLSASAMPPAALAVGESATRTFTLTPAAGTPLNSLLTATIKASFGAADPVSLAIPVQVVVPGAQAIAGAAITAGQLGNAVLADRLRDLSIALTNLVQDPGNLVFKGQVLANLDALIQLLQGDPTFVPFVADLTAARDALAAADTSAAILAAVTTLGGALDGLATQLTNLALHDFDFSLSPNTAVAQPQIAAQLGLVLRNTGTQSSTYAFAVENLPAGITASFIPPTITLAPGDVVPRLGVPGVALTLTPTSTTELQPAGFLVRATVQQAPDVQRTAAGALSVRREQVSVVEVNATPAFTDAGGQVAVEARVLNSVNQSRNALISYVVKDPGAQVVASSAPQPVALDLLSSIQNVALGTLDTTGFANGAHTIEVSVTESDGTPIPGATGTGSLLIGSPVTAFMTLAPKVLPPGDAQVGSTLQLDSDVAFSAPFTLRGLVDTSAIGGTSHSIVIVGTLAYVCTTEGIGIVDVSDASAPTLVGTFAGDVLNNTVGTFCTVQGDRLYVVPTFNGGSQVYTFSLADPLHPQQIGFTTFPYEFVSDVFVHGDHAFVTTDGTFFFLGGVNTIFRQFGDFLSVRVEGEVADQGIADVVFNDTGPVLGGLSNFWQLTRVTDTIAYAAGSTSQAGNTQLGNGRILVVDISDPTNLTVLKDLSIPGTVQATGIAFQGNKALVAGSTGGWRNPFHPDFSDLEFLGTTTLTSLDITDPADPLIVGETLTTDFGPIAVSGTLYAAGAGLYAMNGIAVAGAQSVALIDASDPENLIIASGPIPSNAAGGLLNPRAFTLAGNHFYTATALGLGVFEFSNVVGIPVTASVRVPNNTGVMLVPGGFSSAPTQIIPGPDFDTLVWKRAFAAGHTSETISFLSKVSGLEPGEARDVTDGATIDFVAAGTPGQIELPPLTLVADSILGLAPATRTVAPGEPAAYTLTVKNPTEQAVVYDLAVQGVPATWVSLVASVPLGPGATTDLPLLLTANPQSPLGANGFTVTASGGNGAQGSVVGTLVLAGEPVFAAAPAHGVVVSIDPTLVSAGQGTPTFVTVRVTNTGDATDSFTLDLPELPLGVFGSFAQATLEVPPGTGGFRETTLTLISPPGGDGLFVVRATATSDAQTSGTVPGLLTVLAQGVGLTIDPPSGPPTTSFVLTVANAGSQADTFDLTVAGPLASAATLATPSVTLAPGASQAVALTLGQLDLALPGSLQLVGVATSRGDTAARATATAQVTFAATKGVDAMFEPPAIVLPAPGAASFLLNVQNFGNTEDGYSATIVGTTGPVTAVLSGLSDEPTQVIERFVLPGLANGAIPLAATLGAPGAGTVTVRIQSLNDASLFVDATARVSTEGAATPTPTPAPTPSPTPRPSATPGPTSSAGPLDAFKCYAVRSKTGTPRFPGIPGVALRDEFETLIVDVVRERSLCNPVTTGDEQLLDPATHLGCYALRPVPGQNLVVPADASIVNRFGEQTVRFLRNPNERTLCVPAAAHLEGTPDAPAPASAAESFRCRRVSRVAGATLKPMPEITLSDEFETKRMRVRKLRTLCAPVARAGEEIADPARYLACYAVSQVPRQPAFKPPGTVEMTSDLGAQTLVVRNGQRILCVPTQRR